MSSGHFYSKDDKKLFDSLLVLTVLTYERTINTYVCCIYIYTTLSLTVCSVLVLIFYICYYTSDHISS